jgi:hypothetical protein
MRRNGDPSFRAQSLVEWWDKSGRRWVEDFERLNPLMKEEDLVMDPETLQARASLGGSG